jgi:hypothetical protein
VKQSKIANVVRVGTLIRDHVADLGNFMKHDLRGQKLPEYIAQLAEHLENEQTVLSNELTSLRKNIHEILTIQRSYIKISDVTNLTKATAPVEDPPHMNGDTTAQHDVQNLPLDRSLSNSCR